METQQISPLDADRQEVSEQIANLRQEMSERFDELERDIQMLAEGILAVDGLHKLHRSSIGSSLTYLDARVEAQTKNLDGRLRVLEGWADRQRSYVDAAVRQLVERATSPRIEPSPPG